MKPSTLNRARAALAAQQPQDWFAPPHLATMICAHEGLEGGLYATPAGLSDGNMRRICEALAAKGELEQRLKVQGKYRWLHFRLPGAEPESEAQP